MTIYIQFLNQEIRDRLYHELYFSGVSLNLKRSDIVDGYFLIIGIDVSKVWFLVEYQLDRCQITFDEQIGEQHYYELLFNLKDIFDINFTHVSPLGGES